MPLAANCQQSIKKMGREELQQQSNISPVRSLRPCRRRRTRCAIVKARTWIFSAITLYAKRRTTSFTSRVRSRMTATVRVVAATDVSTARRTSALRSYSNMYLNAAVKSHVSLANRMTSWPPVQNYAHMPKITENYSQILIYQTQLIKHLVYITMSTVANLWLQYTGGSVKGRNNTFHEDCFKRNSDNQNKDHSKRRTQWLLGRIVTNTGMNTVSKYCNLQTQATKCTVSWMTVPVHNAYVHMIPHSTIQYHTTLPSADIQRAYAFCRQMSGSTGIVQNCMALHDYCDKKCKIVIYKIIT